MSVQAGRSDRGEAASSESAGGGPDRPLSQTASGPPRPAHFVPEPVLYVPPARPGVPTPVGRLTRDQSEGVACLWCSAELRVLSRTHVGWTGPYRDRLYACPTCVAAGRRLPVWPEYGSV